MAKVSIVVPVYNAGPYIEQCLKSLVEQTLKDIEIILINDGSTDDSLELCLAYARTDRRSRVVDQENAGACVARNKGIQLAKGEYVLFVDADDFFELDMVYRAYAKATETNADIVVFDADVFNMATGQYEAGNWILNKDLLPAKEPFSRDDLPATLFQLVAGGPCNKLMRREFVVAQSLDFPIMKSLEDVPFVYTALAVANRIAVVPMVLQHYRKNAPKAGLVSAAAVYPARIFESYGILRERLLDRSLYSQLEQSFVNRAASDFVDQYLYILKDDAAKEFFGLYLANVVDKDYLFSEKQEGYFQRPFVYNKLNEILLKYRRGSIQKSDSPKVSVVMPVYNVAPFLRQCINSVLCQTLCDFELILVDDGSTDDSLAIIKEYADIDGRIIYTRQSNMYAGVARNTGMERANGEYLLFLDPDDFFAPTLLEDMYNKAESDEADVVLCDGRYYDNVTGKYSNARLLLQRYNIPKTLPFSYLDNPDKILHISIDCPWNKLFRKAFVDAHDLRFQPLRSANDVYFVDCAILLADKISVVDKKLVNYRTNVHTSLQATRAKEPLNFYEALSAVRARMQNEDRYPDIERSLISLFIAGCRSHLNRAKDGEEFTELYTFYRETAFDAWEIDTNDLHQFVYVDDRKWVERVRDSSAIDYLLSAWRDSEKKKAVQPVPQSVRVPESSGGMRVQYYRSYAIGCAITYVPRKIRGLIDCLKEHGPSYTLRRIPEHFGIPAGAEMKRPASGVTKLKRNPRIVVSMTTYPKRIGEVVRSIETLMDQTLKADEIILWLASEQFPDGERSLPQDLLALRKRGLSIKWCSDLKSHKKYYFAMQQYPDDIVVTVDDDLYYSSDMLELLYNAYVKHPDCVCAMRCHLIKFDKNGAVRPYKQWGIEQSTIVGVPSMRLFPTSGAGTLYPPHSLDVHLFDQDISMGSCRSADDVWLKTMQNLKHTPTIQVVPYRPLRYVESTQDEALCHINVDGNQNDAQIENMSSVFVGSWTKDAMPEDMDSDVEQVSN